MYQTSWISFNIHIESADDLSFPKKFIITNEDKNWNEKQT